MNIKGLFDRGEFVVSAEVGPPKGIHVDESGRRSKNLSDKMFMQSILLIISLLLCVLDLWQCAKS